MKTILQNIEPVLAFLTTLVLTIILLPFIIKMVKKYRLVDHPNERSAHTIPTPSLGGLGFLPALLITILILPFSIELLVVIVLAIALMVLGAVDDTKDLKSRIKFIAQFSAAAILFFTGLKLDNLHGMFGITEIPALLAFGATIVLVAAIINAFNLIDGVNGLAGGIGAMNALVFGIIFIIQGNIAFGVLAFAFAGSLFGFLKYNFNLAKIFMGDTGSLVLGLLMAVFFLKVFAYGNTVLSTVAIAMMLFPSLDMTRLFAARILRGVSPFKADKNHYHHLLLKTGDNHKKAAITFYAINATLIVFSACLAIYFNISISFLLTFSLGVVFYAFIEARFYFEEWKKELSISKRIEREMQLNSLYKTLLP